MLSENIKQLRLEKGITQSQLAERLHVVRQTVSKWENGSSVPDALMLQKLANELDTTPDALLDCPTVTAPMPPSYPTISKFWLLFTLFWGLFLYFAPTEQDVFDLWDVETARFVSHAILILSQIRRYLAPSLLGAGVVFTLRSAVRLPFCLPDFVRWGLYAVGNVMAAVSLIIDLQFVLLPYIGLNRTAITDYFWLHDNQWFFALWMTLAAVIIAFSQKDHPCIPIPQPAAIPPMTKSTALWLSSVLFWGLFILLTTPLHNAVTRYEAFGPINNKTVMILWQTRRFFGFPLFAASVISGMLGLLQERLRLPSLPHSLQLIAVIMLLCGLYASLNCTLLNTLPFPWDLGMQLVTHPHWLILWQTAAAALFHLSTKEKSL